eukprot:TRINITY_DN12197_c0_g2_i1.p1 TRINITY_DN12197_c0_g2~~TRINITY_DN12197_c0_g2_i1.p1  ORF type:complete len:895 (+),score=99.63 TRINITY_DN12197_c0_g2_i1:354-2687(+)
MDAVVWQMMSKYRKYCDELAIRRSSAVERLLASGEMARSSFISLAHFGLCDRGILAVCRLLQWNPHLVSINMTDNGLTNVGVEHLLKDLRVHARLSSLELRGNIKVRGNSLRHLLRFLVEQPTVLVLDVEGTGLGDAERGALYLQAYANRMEADRRGDPMPPEPSELSFRWRVENLAKRMFLCRNGIVRAPVRGRPPGPPKDMDVAIYNQEHDQIAMMQRKWRLEYEQNNLSQVTKVKVNARRLSKTATDSWCYLYQFLLWHQVQLDDLDARLVLAQRGFRPRGRVEVLARSSRLQRVITLVERYGIERSRQFQAELHAQMEADTHRLSELDRRMRVMKAVFPIVLLYRNRFRKLRSSINEVCQQGNFELYNSEQLQTLISKLDLWRLELAQKGVDAKTVKLADDQLEKLRAMLERKKKLVTRFRKAGRRLILMEQVSEAVAISHRDKISHMVTTMCQEVEKLDNWVFMLEKRRATSSRSSVRSSIRRSIASEGAADSPGYVVGPREIEANANFLRTSIGEAHRINTLDRRRAEPAFSPELIQAAEDRLAQLDAICERISTVRQVISDAMKLSTDVMGMRFPHQINQATVMIDRAIALVDDLQGARYLEQAAMDTRAGLPKAVITEVMGQLRSEVNTEVASLRAELQVASLLLAQTPEDLALDSFDLRRGVSIGALIPLQKVELTLRHDPAEGSRLLEVVLECRHRLGIFAADTSMSLFSEPHHENPVSEEELSAELSKLRIQPRTAHELFSFMIPFSLANWRRLLFCVSKWYAKMR